MYSPSRTAMRTVCSRSPTTLVRSCGPSTFSRIARTMMSPGRSPASAAGASGWMRSRTTPRPNRPGSGTAEGSDTASTSTPERARASGLASIANGERAGPPTEGSGLRTDAWAASGCAFSARAAAAGSPVPVGAPDGSPAATGAPSGSRGSSIEADIQTAPAATTSTPTKTQLARPTRRGGPDSPAKVNRPRGLGSTEVAHRTRTMPRAARGAESSPCIRRSGSRAPGTRGTPSADRARGLARSDGGC